MGCGRGGSTLAHILEDRGWSVAVIDQNPDAFRRLGSSFKGKKVTGIGFDQDVLEEAGIREAAAFAAVSSGDNSNVISARVARESFGVERVAARIYDPRRAEVYQRLGIPTVATVRWTADQMLRRLLPDGAQELWRGPAGGGGAAGGGFGPPRGGGEGGAGGGGSGGPGAPTPPGWARRCCPGRGWCSRRAMSCTW